MTLRLSDEEAAALRDQADAEHRSMQEVARSAVREYVERRSLTTQVDDVMHVLIRRVAGPAQQGMTTHLTLEVVLRIAERACDGEVQVRAPRTARVCDHASGSHGVRRRHLPTLHGKAAALLHSLATNHALVDGNKRLAWAVTAVFLWINSQYVDTDDDAAFDLLSRWPPVR